MPCSQTALSCRAEELHSKQSDKRTLGLLLWITFCAIPLIRDFEVCLSAIIENHYNQTEKQTASIADLGEPFSVGNLAKDDLAETGMPCVVYGELFTAIFQFLQFAFLIFHVF